MLSKAVILCGGLATRQLPITKSIPKEMLPLGNRPAIDYCIEDLKNNGITDILIILGRNKESIESYYDRNIELEDRLTEQNKQKELELISNYKDINISFIRQINARGTGYATSLAKNFVGSDDFILIYPDDLLIGNSYARQLINIYNQVGTNIIPLQEININNCHKYGMVGVQRYNNFFKITNFIEKPSLQECPSNICYTGGGIFSHKIFKLLTNTPIHTNGEQYLTDIFSQLIRSNTLYGTLMFGTRLDVGTPLDFIKSNILIGLNDISMRDSLLKFMNLHTKKD